MKRVLLVVDLQRQFRDKAEKYKECLDFVRHRRNEYDLVIASIFSQAKDGVVNTNYQDYLGWMDCLGCDERDLDFHPDKVIIKNTYAVDIQSLIESGDIDSTCSIDIMGHTNACVLATCYALWDAGLHFNILTKYIYNTSEPDDMGHILDLMRKNFGNVMI